MSGADISYWVPSWAADFLAGPWPPGTTVLPTAYSGDLEVTPPGHNYTVTTHNTTWEVQVHRPGRESLTLQYAHQQAIVADWQRFADAQRGNMMPVTHYTDYMLARLDTLMAGQPRQ